MKFHVAVARLESWTRLAWRLHDGLRAAVSLSLGGGGGVGAHYALALPWKMSFLLAWILALGVYLALLALVVVPADDVQTRQRVSRDDPNRLTLVIVVIAVTLLGNLSVGVILTSVGKEHPLHAGLLVTLSVCAVLFSWILLHTAFGQYYARLYYEDTDVHGNPFPAGIRGGFVFPGGAAPTYLDFMYISFTLGLTYAMSDVSVTSQKQRKVVLIHSVISFLFYSTVFGAVLNAIVTS